MTRTLVSGTFPAGTVPAVALLSSLSPCLSDLVGMAIRTLHGRKTPRHTDPKVQHNRLRSGGGLRSPSA